MKEIVFPKLQATDIEVRVGSGGKWNLKENKGDEWCNLLFYKDARVDQRLLDDNVGEYNWQREHIIRENIINGQKVMVNYCKVSLWDDEKKMWIAKEDCGTESQTEPIKGEASDAFKRACFNWGIGRELYTAPKTMRVTLTQKDYYNGRLSRKFVCTYIAYDKEGKICDCEVVNDKGDVVIPRSNIELALSEIANAKKREVLEGIWYHYANLQTNKLFVDTMRDKKNELILTE